MSALTLAVVLSLVSAVAYAAGAIVQERVSLSSPDASYAPVHRPAWWAAVGLNGLGAALHVGALAFGPLSLVQPLGALTIVFALPMAALLVHRKAGATAWRGALMASVGLAGLLSLTGSGDSAEPGGGALTVVALITAGAVISLMVAAHAVHRHPAVRGALLAGAGGWAFGIASVFTKTVAEDWSASAPFAQLPSVGVIAVLACGGMLLSQASYRGAGLAAPLSTVTVVNPVVAAAVGLTLFGEHFRYGVAGTVLALGCGVVAAGGLILLTTERIGGGGAHGGDAAADDGMTASASAPGAGSPTVSGATSGASSEAVLGAGAPAGADAGAGSTGLPSARSAAADGLTPADASRAAGAKDTGLLPRGRRLGRPWARGPHRDASPGAPGQGGFAVPGARHGIPVTPLPETEEATLGDRRRGPAAPAPEGDPRAADASCGDIRQRAEGPEGRDDDGDGPEEGGSTPSDGGSRPARGTYAHSAHGWTKF
ncbi:DMT family transporter [Streptomyces tsukubensis]|uniref:DMT family transporter n=1 Tax=Streptomyces tsukubensis TaxID=83656 RepID=UPI001C4E09B1|nr:DMT family transporter [Streptomyces tsukubensis]